MKNKEVTNENLIHVKFEYDEAVEAKKELLQTEIVLLRIAQKMKLYQILRKKELNAKVKLKKRLSGARTDLNRIQKILPKIQTANIQTHIIRTPLNKIKKRETEYNKSLENELREIQEKLNALQQ